MKRDELGDLVGFLTVAEERHFTRAAALLGTSQSSPSHTIHRLDNDAPTILQAAIHGLGLVCLPEDQVKDLIEDGRLVRVLEDWLPPFPGYHLYYPGRRQPSPAFDLLVEALRFRA
jgi:DNA-binding transcriptional LysR family regulator